MKSNMPLRRSRIVQNSGLLSDADRKGDGVSRKPVPSVPPPARRIGDVRVSTTGQNPEMQVEALTAAAADEIRPEKASGRGRSRPVLNSLPADLRAGDVLVCWKLNRVGLSTRHLLEIVEDLSERGIGLIATTQAIDTTTAMGRFFVGVLTAVAELEAETIKERISAGVISARRRGVAFGPQRTGAPSKVAPAKRLLGEPGTSVSAVARTLGVGRSTLYRALGNRS
jgi:DNA invertase Pin-like site-specific DNA recombinase